jgi:diaminopimelate epimerase
MEPNSKGGDPIVFYKMSGHGNDFIVINGNGAQKGMDWRECAQRWCSRRTSVGADGLLVVEPCERADFRLRIFNSDGSEAEMCGNGARCAARFAEVRGIAGSHMTFETTAGIIGALTEGDMVSIHLTEPKVVNSDIMLDINGTLLHVCAIDPGVPHSIVFRDLVMEMPADEVVAMGRFIRNHPTFDPEGTNVDFVEVMGPSLIRVRTYERGVEAETMACGTGAVASAIVSHLYRDAGDSPIAVQMPGGVLMVEFKKEGDEFKDVWLKGEVHWAYKGEIIHWS